MIRKYNNYQEFINNGGEKRWQNYWEEEKIFVAKEDKNKKKFYGLIEFPYPSGDGLHTGHLRSNTAMDIIARKRRMQGYNVLYPIGFDAFGLPTENYAIKKKIKPQEATAKNIAVFTKQLKEAGFSFDWSRVFSTTDEDYYKWTQWIFAQMFKNGLAEKKKENINWCTSCKIGLANEEVVNGICERCGGEVIKKDKEQWVLKITKYADRLIQDLETVDYLERIKTQQVNWIGRSSGAEVVFRVKHANNDANKHEYHANTEEILRIFTTRPDTLFGATFMVVAPEHKIIQNLKIKIQNYGEVEKYINEAKKKSDLERADLNKEKTGVEIKGIKAINPVNGKEIPIFVADYVMMGYGTGAIMAVPAHDERDMKFAIKYKLPIIEVVKDIKALKHENIKTKEECFTGEGEVINSGEFDGLSTAEFKEEIIKWLEERGLGRKMVNYKLHDWIFSRQRYWGEPIPLVFCENCAEKIKNQKSKIKINEEFNEGEILNLGWHVDENLPVVLPEIDDYLPTNEGDSPLAKDESWVKTKCPVCGGEARRETDVMPNWAGSNWYFIRYCDPKNNQMMVDPEKAKYWLPVDWYNGGMEHTTLHLLYSRFVWKFLYDIGAVPRECGSEPYAKRTAHGMILGEGGVKMSKSKGNVINPDDYVKKYGADTLRIYEMFMGPFDQPIAWEDKSVNGVYRFLNRAWGLQEKINNKELDSRFRGNDKSNLSILLNQTIKKVGEDIEEMKFNTAVAQMMILLNELEKQQEISIIHYTLYIILLSPFAPHLAEELWQKLGHEKSLVFEKWPEYDPKLIQADEFELVIQINGKVRDKITMSVELTEEEVKKLALESEKVRKWLEGKELKKMVYIKGKLLSIVI